MWRVGGVYYKRTRAEMHFQGFLYIKFFRLCKRDLEGYVDMDELGVLGVEKQAQF